MKDSMSMAWFTSVVNGLRDAAFACLTPSRCRVCRSPLFGHEPAFLCAGCAAAMPWIGPGACATCGYPAGDYAAHGKECRRCRSGWMGLSGSVSVARYRSAAKVLVKTLKYSGEQDLAAPLSGLMAERLRAAPFFGKPELVVSVSLHARRRRERGFDQAALLARGVAEQCGLEYGDGLLERIRWTPPQAGLARKARLANCRGAFTADSSVSGRRVLVVDDVMTTGATIAECAMALRSAGARSVYGLTFAR
jgi:ComF family protein